MNRIKDIKATLKRYESELKEKFKVKKIGIFGSFARGKQGKRSDIDILVEFYEPIGWEFIDLNEYLENILRRKVDLVTPAALKRQIKNSILREVVPI